MFDRHPFDPAQISKIGRGDVYRIMEQSSPQVELKLRLVPRGSLSQMSSVGALEVLTTRGCEQQAVTALRKVVARQ